MFTVQKQLPAPVILVALCLLPSWVSAQRTKHLTKAEGKALLDQFACEFTTVAEWQARAKGVKQGILHGMKLDMSRERAALNTIIHNRQVF